MNWKVWVVGRNPKTMLIRLVIVGLVSFVVFRHAIMPIRYHAEAMAPHFEQGELLWVNRLAYWRTGPERGDIVAIRLAGDRVVRVARVVALPGEVLSLQEGVIYIDDEPASLEPFELPFDVFETGYESELIKDGEIFVLGDNRQMSLMELHTQGAMGNISVDRVLGKVLF